ATRRLPTTDSSSRSTSSEASIRRGRPGTRGGPPSRRAEHVKRDHRRRGVVAWVVAAVVGATTLAAALGPGALGSADGEGARAAPADLRLPGSAATMEGLGRSVLEALVRGDTAALASLRLTREEH